MALKRRAGRRSGQKDKNKIYPVYRGIFIYMWIINKKFILGALILLIISQFIVISSLWVQTNLVWLDIPMHALGGFLVAAIFLAFLEERNLLVWSKNNLVNFILTVSFVMLIGVLWEFYEYASNYFSNEILNYGIAGMNIKDTLGDLFFDLVGGSLAADYYFWSRARR